MHEPCVFINKPPNKHLVNHLLRNIQCCHFTSISNFKTLSLQTIFPHWNIMLTQSNAYSRNVDGIFNRNVFETLLNINQMPFHNDGFFTTTTFIINLQCTLRLENCLKVHHIHEIKIEWTKYIFTIEFTCVHRNSCC